MIAYRFNKPFAGRKGTTILLALAVTIILGGLDFATGREIVISPLYLLPIFWTSWLAGRQAGYFLAWASTVAWLLADMLEHHAYPLRATPYWNALMLLVFFVVNVYLLTAVHDAQNFLEDTVVQRTAALRAEMTERKRLEADKIRAERLATVGTMAAEVAHEIRNPLGAIVLNLDLFQKEITYLALTSRHNAAEAGELVGEMRAEVHRIQKVLEDYLKFARLAKPVRRPLAINDLLEQKLAFTSGELAPAGVILRTEFDPTMPPIQVDADQLWQATLNLIRNSLEAMPGGGELTISTRHDDGHAILRVRDSGQGMSDEALQKIFEPFFSTKPSGTGLGLALVQQIVHEHGGRVECDSASGKGCTFTLFLPVMKAS